MRQRILPLVVAVLVAVLLAVGLYVALPGGVPGGEPAPGPSPSQTRAGKAFLERKTQVPDAPPDPADRDSDTDPLEGDQDVPEVQVRVAVGPWRLPESFSQTQIAFQPGDFFPYPDEAPLPDDVRTDLVIESLDRPAEPDELDAMVLARLGYHDGGWESDPWVALLDLQAQYKLDEQARVQAGAAALLPPETVREQGGEPPELELQPLAREQLSTNGTREEAYLMAVGQLLARLRTPTIPELRGAMGGYMQEHGEAGLEFYVTMFDLEAGKGFSHHDHRDYNGVILGVDGEVRIRNYDIVGDELVPPAGATFQIRQTRDDLILPGRFSSLGRARENVHDVTAGAQGGRVLDAFTFYRPDGQSYFMDVDETPRDAERGIFDAAWTG